MDDLRGWTENGAIERVIYEVVGLNRSHEPVLYPDRESRQVVDLL
jgi:hypothetical protein